MQSSKTEQLTIKVYDLLRAHDKLTDSEVKKDVTVWGYSNPIPTKFTSVEEAVSFFRQFDELGELNLSASQFRVFANSTLFTIEKVVIIRK